MIDNILLKRILKVKFILPVGQLFDVRNNCSTFEHYFILRILFYGFYDFKSRTRRGNLSLEKSQDAISGEYDAC